MNKVFDRLSETLRRTYHQEKTEPIALFPGIDLVELRFQAASFSLHHPPLQHILQINYCKAGRMGWKTQTGNYCYLGPGDFSVHGMGSCADSRMEFPTGVYEGILIVVDFLEAARQPSDLLKGTGLLETVLPEKFCREEKMLSFAGTPQTESIFSGFASPHGSAALDLAWKKSKALELLLMLAELRVSPDSQLSEYRAELVETMREIHQYLLTHLDRRITIEELSKRYHMNPTTLKATFKSVYGTSLAAHIKEHRMEKAASLLTQTGLSVAQIARAVGYDSQSKFSTAFRSVYEVLPKDFRKRQSQKYAAPVTEICQS